MKPAVIAVLLLCFAPAISRSQTDRPQRGFFLQAKIRHDFSSATGMIGGLHLDDTHGIEAELMYGEPADAAFGGGIGYQFPREMGHSQQGEIAFLPVYLRVQKTLLRITGFSLYAGVRLGCNMVFLDGGYRKIYTPEGGPCFGILFGCLVRDEILIEGSVTSLSGNLRRKDGDSYNDEDIGVPQLSLGVGFLFD